MDRRAFGLKTVLSVVGFSGKMAMVQRYPLDTNEKREGWRHLLSCMEYIHANQDLCNMLAFQYLSQFGYVTWVYDSSLSLCFPFFWIGYINLCRLCYFYCLHYRLFYALFYVNACKSISLNKYIYIYIHSTFLLAQHGVS